MKPKLFVGPMSKNIVDAVAELSKDVALGLCASRRQIEEMGGYVNNWTTKDFVNYVKNRTHNVLIARDHGGPRQGKKEDDGYG